MINPLDFDPAGPLNYRLAYMMCTWSRLVYRSPVGENAAHYDTLKTVIGADEWIYLFEQDLGVLPIAVLRVDIARGPWGTATFCRGTATFEQLVNELLISGLVPGNPFWTGNVNQYFYVSAINTFSQIQGHLSGPWLSCGHSLGGSVAGLMSFLGPGATRVWSNGAPREGDQTYVDSRNNAIYLRLVNTGDPVPLVPPSGTFVGPFDTPPILNIGHRHWGYRHLLWMNATETISSDQGLGTFFEAIPTGVQVFTSVYHLMDAYTFRVRLGIPVSYPLLEPHPLFPDVYELDQINRQLNSTDGTGWNFGVSPRVFSLPPPRPVPIPVPPYRPDPPNDIEFPCGPSIPKELPS